jgi:hypothetical protein
MMPYFERNSWPYQAGIPGRRRSRRRFDKYVRRGPRNTMRRH